MYVVYIADYVALKDLQLTENQLKKSIKNYFYQKYGKFTDSSYRGRLNMPLI